jgi:hypothetical protein
LTPHLDFSQATATGLRTSTFSNPATASIPSQQKWSVSRSTDSGLLYSILARRQRPSIHLVSVLLVMSLTALRNSVVFIHGLRGHPQFTWEYTTSPLSIAPLDATKAERHLAPSAVRSLFPRSSSKTRHEPYPKKPDTAAQKKTVCWPAALLPEVLPDCSIWTYGYNADVIGFFGQNNKNSILKHANDFMVKLERTLRDDVRSTGCPCKKNLLLTNPRSSASHNLCGPQPWWAFGQAGR